MQKQPDTLTFIGSHPETDKPMCGLITNDFDVTDAPFYFTLRDSEILVLSANKQELYEVPQAVIDTIRLGADFYIANDGGSGLATLATQKITH